MPGLNYGTSPYHSIQGLFCRSRGGQLLNVDGRAPEFISSKWSLISEQLFSNETKVSSLPSGKLVETTLVDLPSCSEEKQTTPAPRYQVRELYRDTDECYVGLISSLDATIEGCDDPSFRDWIETFFLLETTLRPRPSLQQQQLNSSSADKVSEQITVLFEGSLRNVAAVDEWETSGRSYFRRRVFDFVVQNEAIQFGLPAFPCKSPNSRKVGTSHPDMAERMALNTLRSFVRNVKRLYTPGATVWIISDGHVFSDCIGVDDDLVLKYDDELKDVYKSMSTSADDLQAIRFCGLTDFFSSNTDNTTTFSPTWIQPLDLPHPIHTTRSSSAETARKIMMAACQPDRAHFRKLICDQHAPTLSLYRGQSRFMLGDLVTAEFVGKSASQQKKAAFKVAAEMIARNQAYSNLVELLFPNYVRLSIHAHPNRGPKFGIRLFPKDTVRAINSVEERHELVPEYEFQLPTPWHNCIIRVAGDKTVYLAKAEVAREAVAGGSYEGGWVEDDEGGRFELRSIQLKAVESTESLKSVETLEPAKGMVVRTATIELPGEETRKAQSHSPRLSFVLFIASSLSFIKRALRSVGNSIFGKYEGGKTGADARRVKTA